MEKSVPSAILPDVQEIRPGAVPLPARSAALGCRLFGNRRGRGAGRSAIRIGRPVHRRALRWVAHLFDHPTGLDRYADHRADIAERRTRQDGRTVHRGGLQFTVSSFSPRISNNVLFFKNDRSTSRMEISIEINGASEWRSVNLSDRYSISEFYLKIQHLPGFHDSLHPSNYFSA